MIQEIIKVRERIPHIGPITKVIRLKLFLDIVPSSFAEITRALRGCFDGRSVYVSFGFVLKQVKPIALSGCLLSYFDYKQKEVRLWVCSNTFRLNEKRMPSAAVKQ